MRLDRPIGIWLLLWPTLWGLWLAAGGVPPLGLLLIFIAGTVLMRSAGCVINDYADRDFDPHVERTRDRPVVTQGARGGLWLDGKRPRRYAAERARVVDTTGAGDVFHGAFAAGLCRGLAFEACLELAARAAAGNCAALGGAGRLMTRDEWPSSAATPAGRSSRRSRPGR